MDTQIWSKEVLEKIHEKMSVMNQRHTGKIPYIAVDGHYNDMNEINIAWWTNGFFAGTLWQLYQETQEVAYRENAEKIESLLDRSLIEFVGLHHDVGFMWLHTSVANYRLTGDEFSKTRAIHAATLLAGRFNLNGGFIRAWNKDFLGWVIIDSMMNLPLLYFAAEVTGDTRFAQIATTHADTIIEHLVRPDGSVGHIGSFDSETGAFIELLAGQGYAPDSAWTRGQAWAIYGFALCYKYTKDERYLAVAQKIANYFIAHVSQTDYVPIVDFKAPIGTTKLDTSAGTCAACGLLEIAEYVNESDAVLYRQVAEKILRNTEEKHGNWNLEEDGMIENGSHSYHQVAETHIPLVYGDYFFVEGILRLQNKAFDIW
ncbi:glycoside hydrolase family 88 protein [Carnobacterium gallinarum]|uniref:glycoside hydrolase family 88 protein n=1 Tax=Carnobacterium gallinarum TaxID=2749 RepID=UPI0005543A72|nr:glycoside hydrolase family 88 protein [Carnobacterium gallinarum]